MGMDCYSSFDENIKFRANIWQWAVIMELIRQNVVLPGELFEQMGKNGGLGPDAMQCKEIAEVLSLILCSKGFEHTFYLEGELPYYIRNHNNNIPNIKEFLAKQHNVKPEAISLFAGQNGAYISSDDLEEFINFCFQCHENGGFEVW